MYDRWSSWWSRLMFAGLGLMILTRFFNKELSDQLLIAVTLFAVVGAVALSIAAIVIAWLEDRRGTN